MADLEPLVPGTLVAPDPGLFVANHVTEACPAEGLVSNTGQSEIVLIVRLSGTTATLQGAPAVCELVLRPHAIEQLRRVLNHHADKGNI